MIKSTKLRKCPRCNKRLHLEYYKGRYYEGPFYVRKCMCTYIDKVYLKEIEYKKKKQ